MDTTTLAPLLTRQLVSDLYAAKNAASLELARSHVESALRRLFPEEPSMTARQAQRIRDLEFALAAEQSHGALLASFVAALREEVA